MRWLFIGSGVAAAVAYAVLAWGPVAKAPIIPPDHPSPAVVQPPALPPPDPVLPVAEPVRSAPEPRPQVQDPLRLQTQVAPVQARQGSTQAAEPMSQHRRLARPANNQVGQVNRPVANSFTAELNRQEMQSLEAGGRTPPSAPWRELGPYR